MNSKIKSQEQMQNFQTELKELLTKYNTSICIEYSFGGDESSLELLMDPSFDENGICLIDEICIGYDETLDKDMKISEFDKD